MKLTSWSSGLHEKLIVVHLANTFPPMTSSKGFLPCL